MKKMVFTALAALVVGLFLGSACHAGRIDLDAPEDRPDIARVVVDDVSDHPDRQELSFRVSLQYQEGDEWREGADFARTIDNVDTPLYTQLMNLIALGRKSIERIILERIERRPQFDGVISETPEGELILTLVSPRTRPDAQRIVVERVSDRPRDKQFVIIGSVMYREGTEWKRHRRVRKVLEDTDAVADDPSTPEDESVPAKTDYSDFTTKIKLGGKSIDRAALEELVKDFPGMIQ